MYIYICVYIRVYIYVYTYMCMYTYIYIHTHTHIYIYIYIVFRFTVDQLAPYALGLVCMLIRTVIRLELPSLKRSVAVYGVHSSNATERTV